MSSERRFRLLVALLLTLSLSMLLGSSCSGGGGSNTGSQTTPTGSASFFITDAPSDDFDRILVTIERLELLGDGGKATIFTGRETIDLKDLEHFSDLFVYAEEVPVGVYSKIRMDVSKIQLIREGQDGEIIDVKPPANGKLDLVPEDEFEIREGVTLVIELDMDAKRSIHYVETGNGKYQFRPVVFITIGETRSPAKLARVHGEIVEILDVETFELCSTTFMASRDVAESAGSTEGGLGDRHRCMTVELDRATGVFDSNGDPARPGSLAVGDEVTVIGRYHLVDENHDDPIATPRGADGFAAREHRWHERTGSGASSGGDDTGADTDSSDSGSQGDTDSDEAENEGTDEDSDSENDADSDIGSDSDSDGDGSGNPAGDIVFLAYVIQVGPPGTFLTLRGTIESDVVADEFDFGIAPGQGFGDDGVVTALLQYGTGIFSRRGIALDESEIVPDTDAVIDGVFMTDAAGTIYKTSLIVLDVAPDDADVLRGEITLIDRRTERLRLLLEDGAEECVDVGDDVEVFLIKDEGDRVTSVRGSLDDLRAGWDADVYGAFIGFGCFTADTVIAFPTDIACRTGNACDPLDFCAQTACGAPGTCEVRPEACTLDFNVVCGCDGETYANDCQANAAGTSVAGAGSCDSGGGLCTVDDAPACGLGELCLVVGGKCDDSAAGICVVAPTTCSDVERPVCGCDGRTYRNACRATRAGVVVESPGECADDAQCSRAKPGSCEADEVCRVPAGRCDPSAAGVCVDAPDTCEVAVDPVCGCDGVTYPNRCLALKAGVTVSSEGTCRPPPTACGGENPACLRGEVCRFEDGICDDLAEGVCVPEPVACPGIHPVCGCDGKTQANACIALKNNVPVAAEGACGRICGGSNAACPTGEVCRLEQGVCDPDAEGVCVDVPDECRGGRNPVCGCDDVTYANACKALQAGAVIASRGACDDDEP